jgi:hypothetical protein
MKTCPYCAEDIQDAAVVCKHCGRELAAGSARPPAPKPKRRARSVAIGVGLLLVLAFIGSRLDSTSSSPKALTAEQLAAIDTAHASHAWSRPKSIELRSGFVVVDYEIDRPLIPPKTLGETRLLAIREALLPFGYKNFRVNVNGVPPGTGVVRRYGSARVIAGGQLEWLTP